MLDKHETKVIQDAVNFLDIDDYGDMSAETAFCIGYAQGLLIALLEEAKDDEERLKKWETKNDNV